MRPDNDCHGLINLLLINTLLLLSGKKSIINIFFKFVL